MIPPFDIFKVMNGHFVWVQASPTLDTAKARVNELMAERPTEYLIFSQVTQNKILLRPGDSTWSMVNREGGKDS